MLPGLLLLARLQILGSALGFYLGVVRLTGPSFARSGAPRKASRSAGSGREHFGAGKSPFKSVSAFFL